MLFPDPDGPTIAVEVPAFITKLNKSPYQNGELSFGKVDRNMNFSIKCIKI